MVSYDGGVVRRSRTMSRTRTNEVSYDGVIRRSYTFPSPREDIRVHVQAQLKTVFSYHLIFVERDDRLDSLNSINESEVRLSSWS